MTFAIADTSHDSRIRQLLRDTPMPGAASLSLRCEPSYFGAMSALGGETKTIVALHRDRVICVGSVTCRSCFYNGQLQPVTYFGHLRLAAEVAGRFDIIRRGYAICRTILHSQPASVCFTSIASDNHRARRFLERGLPGLPSYRPIGELVTLLIPVRQRRNRTAPSSDEAAAVSANEIDPGEIIPRRQADYQLMPTWSPAIASGKVWRGLYCRGTMVGCAALWDQRLIKQVMVTRYSRALATLRPVYNGLAAVAARGIRLPQVGEILPQGFVAHLFTQAEDRSASIRLIKSLMGAAREAGIEVLAVGLDARDPRVDDLCRAFKPRIYRTRLYTIVWSDNDTSPVPDGRLFNPEIALL